MEESDQTLRMGDSHYTDSVEIPLKLHFRRNVQKGSRIRFRSLTKVWSSKKFLSLVFSFTHTYNTSDTRCVPFPPATPTNSPSPAGYPAIQFNSDTNWH